MGVTRVLEIFAGHYKDYTSDKVWGAALLQLDDGTWSIVRSWGRRGRPLNTSQDHNASKWAMTSKFAKLRSEKSKEGYKGVNWTDDQYGLAAAWRNTKHGDAFYSYANPGGTPAKPSTPAVVPNMPPMATVAKQKAKPKPLPLGGGFDDIEV
jgi:predicted DNA-binding WGR domain protein